MYGIIDTHAGEGETIMQRGQSLYLDLLRLIAAVEVFAFHLGSLPGTGVGLSLWNSFGHEAVTVFFVLSGFVIRHAAQAGDKDIASFAVSRLTRVLSVAVPCVLLTLLFDAVGHHAAPALYEGLTPDGSTLLRVGIALTMLNEAWVSVQVFSNTPYWSISYEFWYYCIFAALFYLRGRWMVIGAIIAACIAGPKIMLLFPIWLMGWFAYRETGSARWPRMMVWLAFLQPVLALAAYDHFAVQRVAADWLEAVLGDALWRDGLAWSRYVLSDSMLGISVALHLMAVKRLGPVLEPLLRLIDRPIRWAAARSFTLYLLHQPAILLSAALIGARASDPFKGVMVASGALLIVGTVAAVTESQRHRLKPLMRWLVNNIAQRVRPLHSAHV